MSLLDGSLSALFGTAFSTLFRDATLAKLAATDDGSGGFATSFTSVPIKVLLEAVSDRARAASGLPDLAVTILVLQAGLSVTVDLDDALIVAGLSYRVIKVDADPAGAAWTVVAVPS